MIWLDWLEKHINAFFKINGILMLFIAGFAVWIMLLAFYQWHMTNFSWQLMLIYSAIYMLFSILCFTRKYYVFPMVAVFLCFFSNGPIDDLSQVVKYNFVFPVNNLGGMVGFLFFILAIFGTILWVRKLMGKA